MPLPTPQVSEPKDAFIDRCMVDESMLAEYPDAKQRFAVCSAQIEKSFTPDFKYFMKVEKAYEEGGEIYVQGIASGIREDRDHERMTRKVLERFVSALPLPLTDSHPRTGEILGVLGEVIYGEVLNDADNSLFIKAKLDRDNPSVPYMVKKIQEGKKFAFSIEGNVPFGGSQQTWSERLGKFVREFINVIPKSVSITTEPSYLPSFLEVVSKSYDDSLKKSVDGQSPNAMVKNINVNSTAMPEDKKPDEVVDPENKATTTTEPEKAAEVTPTPEAEKQPESEKEPEVPATPADPVEPQPETPTTEPTEPSPEPAAPVEVKKAVKKAEGDMDDPVGAEEEAETQDEKESEEDKATELEKALSKAMAPFMERLDKVEEALGAVAKADEEKTTVMKSLHDELETLKSLPLQKKSKVGVVSKSFEERKEPEADFKSIAQKFVG